MKTNRRKWLRYSLVGTGAAAGLGALWFCTTDRRRPRFFRQMIADTWHIPEPAPAKPQPATWKDDQITLAWLGHATVLINFYGLKILTDPVFSDRVGLDFSLGVVGPKRQMQPALRMLELPPVDLVLVSHAHYDHLDIPSLLKLEPNTQVVTAKDTSDIYEPTRFKNIVELGWGDRQNLRLAKGAVEIQAFEVNHWGQRWPQAQPRGYNGYIIRRENIALLFGGDTAYTNTFDGIRSHGPFEIGIMPIGAYNPWIKAHCTPEQAVEMANRAGARYLVPIHHRCFRLSDEPMEEPIQRFEAALAAEKERIALRNTGETFVLPRT